MKMLHVGCGRTPLPLEFSERYEEVRVDIDPDVSPDIVAGMTDLADVDSEGYDALYCCHALEHLYPYEVVPALREFARVLKPGGFALVVVPDLQDVKPTEEPVWHGICGLHMIYGWPTKETPYMAHHSGFVQETLERAILAAFPRAIVNRDDYQLFGFGVKHAAD